MEDQVLKIHVAEEAAGQSVERFLRIGLGLSRKKKRMWIPGGIAAVLGVLAVLTNLGADYPWLTIGIPAIPSLYFDWFGGCIQAFIFCTLTTLFIKQAAGD